jgi:hypothetical protein
VTETEKRRAFQEIKSMSLETFWAWFGIMTTRAYVQGVKHVEYAMSVNDKIYRPTVEQVLDKTAEIRELWEGIQTLTVDEEEKKELDRILSRRGAS